MVGFPMHNSYCLLARLMVQACYLSAIRPTFECCLEVATRLLQLGGCTRSVDVCTLPHHSVDVGFWDRNLILNSMDEMLRLTTVRERMNE